MMLSGLFLSIEKFYFCVNLTKIRGLPSVGPNVKRIPFGFIPISRSKRCDRGTGN